jgi:solute carrier family 1 (glutamate transporter) protein 7
MENKERATNETQTDFASIISEDTINIETNESKDQKELFLEKLTLNYLKIAMMNNLMLILIYISAALGIGISILLKTYTSLSYDAKIYFAFPGELFFRALKFISLPLVFVNLIIGMSGLVNKSKKIGLYALRFYSLSLVSSLLVGFLIVLTIQPGYRSSSISNIVKHNTLTQPSTISDTILDILRNLIPGI